MLLLSWVKTGLAETKQSSRLLFVGIVILSENAFVSSQGSCCRQVCLEFMWLFPCKPCSDFEDPVTLISSPEMGGILCLLLQFKSEFSIRFRIPSVCFYFCCLQRHWYLGNAWFGFSHNWEWLMSQAWNIFVLHLLQRTRLSVTWSKFASFSSFSCRFGGNTW